MRSDIDPGHARTMLVQTVRNELPEHGAHLRLVHLVDTGFGITVLRGAGFAVDWGMQAEAVRFIARMHRTQVSIVLAGHGYFSQRSGVVWLRPGDVVESDQRLQEPEGYGAGPFEVLMIEWDDGAVFGRARRGDARTSRLDAAAVARLRALVARLLDGADARSHASAAAWITRLCALLATLGFGVEHRVALHSPAPPTVARVYELLGDAVSQLEKNPSLGEVADSLALTERQAHRYLAQIEREYTPHHGGWRDTLRDARIGAAMQYLSVPGLSLARVARLAGYRSLVAMTHAFAEGGTSTPGDVARRLAQRWR